MPLARVPEHQLVCAWGTGWSDFGVAGPANAQRCALASLQWLAEFPQAGDFLRGVPPLEQQVIPSINPIDDKFRWRRREGEVAGPMSSAETPIFVA